MGILNSVKRSPHLARAEESDLHLATRTLLYKISKADKLYKVMVFNIGDGSTEPRQSLAVSLS